MIYRRAVRAISRQARARFIICLIAVSASSACRVDETGVVEGVDGADVDSGGSGGGGETGPADAAVDAHAVDTKGRADASWSVVTGDAGSALRDDKTGLVIEIRNQGLAVGVDLDTVKVRLTGERDERAILFAVTAGSAPGKSTFPIYLAVTKAAVAVDAITIEVDGFMGNGPTNVHTGARVDFDAGKVKVVVLTLKKDCLDVKCGGSEKPVCVAGECAAIPDIDATTLPDYASPDAGSTITMDAAPDAASCVNAAGTWRFDYSCVNFGGSFPVLVEQTGCGVTFTEPDDNTPKTWVSTGTIDNAGKITLSGKFGFTSAESCSGQIVNGKWTLTCPNDAQKCTASGKPESIDPVDKLPAAFVGVFHQEGTVEGGVITVPQMAAVNIEFKADGTVESWFDACGQVGHSVSHWRLRGSDIEVPDDKNNPSKIFHAVPNSTTLTSHFDGQATFTRWQSGKVCKTGTCPKIVLKPCN